MNIKVTYNKKIDKRINLVSPTGNLRKGFTFNSNDVGWKNEKNSNYKVLIIDYPYHRYLTYNKYYKRILKKLGFNIRKGEYVVKSFLIN